MRLLAILTGCGSSGATLETFDIVGGSAEQAELLRAVAADFERAVGVDRVTIRRITLEEADERSLDYDRARRRITLRYAPDAPLSVGGTLRNALGVALAFQDDLAEVDPTPIEALDVFLCTDAIGCEDTFELAVGFAAEIGPYWAADVDGGTCAEPEPLAVAVSAWMLANVWSAFVLPEPVALGEAVEVALDDIAAIRPTEEPGVVLVTASTGALSRVDLYTGEVLDSTALGARGGEEIPIGLGPLFTAPGQYAGWADGPAAVVGGWQPAPLFGSGPRVLAHDGLAWAFVGDGCAEGGELAFTADERVWIRQGSSWSPVP
jgi:hypothetical protein